VLKNIVSDIKQVSVTFSTSRGLMVCIKSAMFIKKAAEEPNHSIIFGMPPESAKALNCGKPKIL